MIAFSCHCTVFALNELSNAYEVEIKFSPVCFFLFLLYFYIHSSKTTTVDNVNY